MSNFLSRKQTRDELLNICRQFHRTGQLKRANTGGTAQAFEQAFANLATASLQDRAPGLMDYLLGFQLVEKSDENDRAIGIFGFKVGEQLIYAPVFFLNGELKGEELLYLPGTDSFVPRDEQWVNYLINRKPISIGKPVAPQDMRRNVSAPNFDMFKELPTKYGSCIADWALEGVAGFVKGSAEYTKPELVVPVLIQKSAAAARSLFRLIDAYPTLVNPIMQCYGPDLIKQAVLKLKERNTLQLNTLPTHKTASDLQIYTEFVNEDKLTQPEKLEVRRTGYLIKDAREKASVAYKTQEELTLQSPDRTGFYNVLIKPAIFEKCFVSLSPVGVRDTEDARKLVIKMKTPRKWMSTSGPDILTSEEDLCEDYNKWLKGLPTTRTLSRGNTYVLISSDGKRSTGIFRVQSVIGTNGGKTFAIAWQNNPAFDNARNRIMGTMAFPVDSNFVHRDSWQNTITTLTVSEHATDFVELGDTLLIPKDVKVFKVETSSKDEDEVANEPVPVCEYNEYDANSLALANQSDIKLLIIKNSSELKVYTTDHEAYINDKRFTLKDALFHLVKDHGLREKAAKDMLNASKHGERFRIKYAVNPYHLQGPGIPTEWADESAPSADSFLGSEMPMQVGEDHVMPYADMSGLGPEEFDADELTQEADIQRQLERAQQTGQKEVFDTQLLGTLLNTSREDNVIDEHLPDLVKGLDATSRLLFNMYWHNDQFVERFGEREVNELEDSLRNTVSQLGDLTMALKKREVGPRADDGLDVDLAALGIGN